MAIGDAASAAPLTEPGLQALGGDFLFRQSPFCNLCEVKTASDNRCTT
jgi:hypothetical protein